MRKLIPLLLALVLCLAISACGENPPTDNNTLTTGKGNIHTPTKAPTNPADSNQPDHTHNWTDATCTTAKFCTTCGVTEGEALGHNWAEATCTIPKTCTVCGVTEGEVLNHNWEEATCLAPKTCTTCGETEGYTGDCVYVETARVEATKTTDGSVTYTCVCGNSYEEILYAIGSAGLEYSQNDNGTLTVTGIGTCTDAHVVIPQYFNGSKVTAIGKRAFYNLTDITEVTIPESITEIGTQIFYKCSDLHTVYYNSTYYSSDNPFLSISNIKTLVLGNTIPTALIQQATNIKEVILAEGITSIEERAFKNCGNLISVVISDSVTSIQDEAFNGCSGLTSVNLGNGVTSIGYAAFYSCRNLTSISIPSSVTSIGISAFWLCESLISITIPDSVTKISRGAFGCCKKLVSVTMGDGITSIEREAFYGCNSLTSITIPNGVSEIEYLTFGQCWNLTNIIIPDSVTSIGEDAFFNCEKLVNVVIPDSVLSIEDGAFDNCESLQSITIPNSITSIGFMAFDKELKSIYFGGTVEQWKNAVGMVQVGVSDSCIIYCTDGEIKK